jgi:hypothetical protein
MVIFVDQIAFIHVQPSSGKEAPVTPEIHVHFSAGLSTPAGSRSMRAVIRDEEVQDFIEQLEKYEVDCSHIRRSAANLRKPA